MSVDAMLKHANKSRKQRENKPMRKHGNETYKIGCVQHDCASCKRRATKLAAKDALIVKMAEALEKARHKVRDRSHRSAIEAERILDAALTEYRRQQG